MKIHSSGKTLGARIEGLDLAQPVSDGDFKQILRALGERGVLCFPKQRLETEQFARFGRMFGELEINVANQFHESGFPEVMVLSNMTADGKPIGLGDAGQGWHTDMSYSKEIALANVLYAIKVPARDGRRLGDTQFRNMHAAYEDLPSKIKTRLKGRTATHDFAKFWDMTRARPGSQRAALTAEQRAKKPAVSQPIFRTHPITGRTILYCNPGYATRIDGMPEAESAELLAFLFEHQEQEKYMGGGRRADVGQHRHGAQCRCRLPPARAALHAPRAGHGDQGLRPPRRLSERKSLRTTASRSWHRRWDDRGGGCAAECQGAREAIAAMRAEASSVRLGISDGDSTASASAQKSLQ